MLNNEFASKNFKWSELECKCGCGIKNISEVAISYLQKLRDALNTPLAISSGARCPTHNKAVGGAPSSRHISTPTHQSDAFDVVIPHNLDASEIIVQAKKAGFRGVGRGQSFIHLDARPSPFEWTYDDKGRPVYK